MTKKNVTVIQARVRDVNMGGHVDNVEAIRVLGEARVRFHGLEGQGEGLFRNLPEGVVTLVASQRADYRSEMRFAGFQDFEVTQWVGHIGGSSFTVEAELRLPGSDKAAVLGETVVVLFDKAAQKSWKISDEVRADLSEYLGEPVALRDRPTA